MTKKLPSISLPLYHITIPSTDFETTFRPFTVKEEKILLTAQESNDLDQVILAIKQIIQNCVTDIDVNELSTFDCDYILVQIRAKSVSNIMEFQITDPDTGKKIDIDVDVSDVKLYVPENHEKHIKISDDTTIVMKYPDIDSFYKSINKKSTIDQFEFMTGCVDMVVVNDEIYRFKDYTKDEIVEFFDGLTGSAIEKIGNFFETMPRLRLEHEYEMNGKKKVFVIQGLETFFLSR